MFKDIKQAHADLEEALTVATARYEQAVQKAHTEFQKKLWQVTSGMDSDELFESDSQHAEEMLGVSEHPDQGPDTVGSG